MRRTVYAPIAVLRVRSSGGRLMLRFCNSSSSTIWTAISFWEPEECGAEGNGWHNIGWYPVAPGACSNVFSNDVGDVNRFWYYYAESDDGRFWAGQFPTQVHPTEAFDECDEPGISTFRRVGFRELDVGDHDDVTLTFTN